MPDRDLQGVKVLVTRPAGQAENLSAGIRQVHGTPLELPLLQITAVPLANPVQAGRLNKVDVLVFVSANAVKYGLSWLTTIPASVQVAVIGQATAMQLQQAGIRIDLSPSRYDSEGLLALPALQHLQNKTVWIVRGEGGREKLAENLRQRGAHVEYLEVYRRGCPDWQAADVRTALAADVITVTSGEALDNLAQLARLEGGKALWAKPLAVFHERIAGRARELGFTLKPVVAEQPSDEALLAALLRWRNEA